jgi:hypothetical protein
MVPFTIFHRLSSLGSGGGVNAGTIPPLYRTKCAAIQARTRGSILSLL